MLHGDEHVESTCSNFRPTQLPTHRHSSSIGTNVLVLETNALKLPAHTATHVHVGTSDFQAELLLKLLLTGTHLRKRAVATLSYSPASTLHPQVIYAIAFSTGLNSVEVD